MSPFDTDTVLKTAALDRFARKDIQLISGAADACNCNTDGYENSAYCYPTPALACKPDAFGGDGCCDTWPDATTSNALDTSCEAMVQGSNRLQRGLLYAQHLNRVFPRRDLGPYVAQTVPAMGHNNSALYAYKGFIATAFAS